MDTQTAPPSLSPQNQALIERVRADESQTVAAARRAAQLELIVALGDGGRGVPAPRGRCRQILFGPHPETEVLLPDGGAARRTPVRALPPLIYDWRARQEG